MKYPKMLEPRRTSAPANTPVTLAEAKSHLRVTDTEESPPSHPDDDLITSLISVATEKLDGWNGDLGRALITQTWRIEWDRFPGSRRINIPVGPIQSVTLKYSDSDNAEQTVSGDDFGVHEDSSGSFIWLDESLDAWPDTYDRRDAVRIDVVAGYGDDTTDIPNPIRQAILLMLAHWYENREQVLIGLNAMELPMAAEALLFNYRRPAFG